MTIIIETVNGQSRGSDDFESPEHLIRYVTESNTTPSGRVWIATTIGSFVNLDHVVEVKQG